MLCGRNGSLLVTWLRKRDRYTLAPRQQRVGWFLGRLAKHIVHIPCVGSPFLILPSPLQLHQKRHFGTARSILISNGSRPSLNGRSLIGFGFRVSGFGFRVSGFGLGRTRNQEPGTRNLFSAVFAGFGAGDAAGADDGLGEIDDGAGHYAGFVGGHPA